MAVLSGRPEVVDVLPAEWPRRSGFLRRGSWSADPPGRAPSRRLTSEVLGGRQHAAFGCGDIHQGHRH